MAVHSEQRKGTRPLTDLAGDPDDGAAILVDRRLLILGFPEPEGVGRANIVPRNSTKRYMSRCANGRFAHQLVRIQYGT